MRKSTELKYKDEKLNEKCPADTVFVSYRWKWSHIYVSIIDMFVGYKKVQLVFFSFLIFSQFAFSQRAKER